VLTLTRPPSQLPPATRTRRFRPKLVTDPFKRFSLSDPAIAFIVAVLWQALMTLLGDIGGRDPSGILDHMMQWDARWYVNIIKEHYTIDPASPAFYPLFPIVVGGLSSATFHCIPYPFLGLLVNTVSLGFAIRALLMISREFGIQKCRYLAVALFLAAPAAIFMHLFYTEAIFIALGFSAYAFALRGRWLLMAMSLAFLTAARLPALLFVGLCGLEYLRAYNWNIKQAVNRNLAYFLLAPTGFLLYGLYLLAVRGNCFAMFSAYKSTKAWDYLSFKPNFFFTIFCAARETVRAMVGARPWDKDITVNYAIPLLCLTLLFGCSIYLLHTYRGKGVPLGVFGLCSLVFFTVNNSLLAVHRYSLPCLTIYIALALIYADHRRGKVLVLSSATVMLTAQAIIMHLLLVTNDFAG
jgi:Mannosyltransferase (PIG-V)